MSVPNLLVKSIKFAGPSDGGVDFSGKLLTNAYIHSDSIRFGQVKQLAVTDLTVSHLTLSAKPSVPIQPGFQRLIMSDSAGQMVYGDLEVYVRDKNWLDISSGNLISGNVSVRDHLVVESLKGVSLLGADESGRVVDANARKVVVQSLEVHQSLNVAAGSSVYIHGAKSAILALDDSGKLTTLAAYVKDMGESSKNNNLRVEVSVVQAESVKSTNLEAKTGRFQEVIIEKISENDFTGEFEKRILVSDKVR